MCRGKRCNRLAFAVLSDSAMVVSVHARLLISGQKGHVLGDEVLHDARCAQALHPTKSVTVLVAALILRFIVDDLYPSIVDVAAAVGRGDLRSALDLAEPVGWSANAGYLTQQIIDMSRASPRPQHRRLREWRVETVDMPPEAADTARHDSPVVLSGLIALVADDRIAIIVPKSKEIGRFFFDLLLPAQCVS
jgi:hypothetical protein